MTIRPPFATLLSLATFLAAACGDTGPAAGSLDYGAATLTTDAGVAAFAPDAAETPGELLANRSLPVTCNNLNRCLGTGRPAPSCTPHLRDEHPALRTCLEYGGGMACFERDSRCTPPTWLDCYTSNRTNLRRLSTCIEYQGGLACFEKWCGS